MMKTTKKTARHSTAGLSIAICLIVISTFVFTNSFAQVGIGVGDTASAVLHLKAGTTSPGTAPLKFTAGPLMTQVEPGAIEYKGHTFYATTYLVRRSIVLGQDVVMSPVTATTTSETTIYTQTMAANYLTAGKVIIAKLNGRYSSTSSGVFTVHVKFNGSDIFTMPSSTGTSSNKAFEMDITSTIRTIGASGTIISFGKVTQDLLASNSAIGNEQTINTGAVNTITVTVTWSVVHASNTLTIEQGYTECVDANN